MQSIAGQVVKGQGFITLGQSLTRISFRKLAKEDQERQPDEKLEACWKKA